MQSYSAKRIGAGQLLPYVALLVTWALVHTSLIVFRELPVFESGLAGPDSYMRMLRVTELYQGWNWFDITIDRANAPYGDTLHWTRPFDLLILLLALPASFGMDFEAAIYLSGIIVSPLLQLTTAFALVWATRPLIRPETWFLPAVAFFLQPGALAYSVVGRADHHTLLMLVFVVTAGFALRALQNPLDARPAAYAGAFAGFGVWLSTEFLLVLLVCVAALGLPWLAGERERAAQSKWFALTVSCVLLVALFVERPLERFLEASYDRVSVVQFLVCVCILLFWRLAESYENRAGTASRPFGRLLLGLFGAASAVLLVNSAYPLFFAGPMAEVDPRILPIWLDRVLEMRPLVPSDMDSLGRFVFYFGTGLMVVPVFTAILLRERRSGVFWTMSLLALACLLLWPVAIKHMRFSGYAEIAFVMALAVVFDRFLQWTHGVDNDLVRGLLRGSTITVLLLAPLTVGTTLMAKSTDNRDIAGQSLAACSVREVAAFLETDPRWAGSQQTILTFLDIGPELLYRTRHAVIGTPYHRNGDGIYDSHRMLATSDPAEARAMMAQRGIDLVLLCLSPAERIFFTAQNAGAGADGGLYQSLSGGQPPAWLTEIELPGPLDQQAKLFRVQR